MDKSKGFKITSVCIEDILQAYKDIDSPLLEKVEKRVETLEEWEMEGLASKLADDYCNQLFWDSLRIIFEDRFLNG